ncbi:GNAT family N-acetyltransferase [Thiocystis violacea]|uniref:GNAT family N-acetyltransferase n=1 Tax=Thiocystis violacea TaxID=13725 RepID=UPI00190643C3|nr:GNAT family N-acetyltransferase [Thiocystis violacea]MBK1725113.1 hypothetical protein [Thiocystis violacea]
MSWDIVLLAGNLGAYRDDWDRLNDTLYGRQPFFDSRFVEPMLKFFATGNERLCIHSSDGVIDGLLILAPRRAGIWSLFAPSQAQIVPVLLDNVAHLQSLFGSLGGFPLTIELQCQDPLHAVISPGDNNLPVTYDQHALTISVTLKDGFENYWSSRSRNLKHNVRRYLRRVEQDASSLRIECHEAADKMQEVVGRYGELESRGWKGDQGTALHATNAQGQFYATLMENFASRGQASIYELYLKERMIASRLCILSSEMLIILKTTYDEALSQYSPGRLLLYLALEREFSLKRVKSVEFYTNANQDQISWSTDQRVVQHVTLFRSSLLKQAYIIRSRLRRRPMKEAPDSSA